MLNDKCLGALWPQTGSSINKYTLIVTKVTEWKMDLKSSQVIELTESAEE
jgi:hypothetical protein